MTLDNCSIGSMSGCEGTGQGPLHVGHRSADPTPTILYTVVNLPCVPYVVDSPLSPMGRGFRRL